MRQWSLKVKFGVYAATLSALALLAGAGVVLPTVYFRQRAELDRQLRQNAGELFRDLENFKGAPLNARSPLGAKFIPLAMHDRFVILKGPEGQILYETPGFTVTSFTDKVSGYTNVTIGEMDLRVGSFQKSPYALQVGADLAQLRTLQKDLLAGLGFAVPLTAILVFAGGFFLGKYAVSPIAKITASAERISVNRFDERLPVPRSNDEIARLTVVLNDAFERLQNSYNAAIRFSADASHQLKTPVAVMRSGLEELRNKDELSESQREEVDSLLQQTRRLTALIMDLLLLAQADSGRLVLDSDSVDLCQLLRAGIDDLEALVLDRSISVTVDIPDSIPVRIDARRIRLALQNIVENAAKYTPDKGSIVIRSEIEKDRANIYIFNTGKPIDPEDQSQIFERFRRGKQVGENISGHGLGLNIAKTLLIAHTGDLTLSKSDPSGTEFKLSLPVAKET